MEVLLCYVTAGFKGNAHVILPGLTACIDCTLDLYPPQVRLPLILPYYIYVHVRVYVWYIPPTLYFTLSLPPSFPLYLVSLSFSFFRTHMHIYIWCLSQILSPTQTCTLSLSLSLSHTHTHTLSLSLSLSLSPLSPRSLSR